MKKYAYLSAIVFLFIASSVTAAPGDTTWVQANNVHLTGGGNYDTTITFPSGSTTYRKIYMIFSLGKYMCPGYNPAAPGTGSGGTGWCGDWDYTMANILMTPGGDTLEIARFITPYWNALTPRAPWSAIHHYVFDVTEYASKLRGSATMRINFQAGSGGFTGNIMFAFIEGTPDRTVTGITRLWHGGFGYGGVAINANFLPVSQTAPAGTNMAELKMLCTGHGGDGSSCCEFTPHGFNVMKNGVSFAYQTVWRDDCGANQLYPQSGTWIYQRSNWCPGAYVYPYLYRVPGIAASDTFNTSLVFDPYTGGAGYYLIEAQLLYHGPMNKPVDASLDQIISPTIDENHFRENPTAGNPVVHVKNTGAAHIDSIFFEYGMVDSPMQHYMWACSLDSLQESDVTLPAYYYQLNNIAGSTDTFNYKVKILTVNGSPDADNTNDQMVSQFAAAPAWPDTMKMWMRTNNEGLISNPAICETSWVIYDMTGAVFAQRNNCALNTTYTDTLIFPPGYYHLVVTDSGCDGLQWWGFSGSGITSGYIFARKMNNANIPMNQNVYGGTYNNDFGCGISQYFSTGSLLQTSISNITENEVSMLAYPNPAKDVVNVELSGLQQVSGTVQLIDALGRTVVSRRCNSVHTQLSTGDLPTGVYTIIFFDEHQQNKKLTTRLVIAK